MMRSGKIVLLTGYGSLLPPNSSTKDHEIRQAVRRIPEIEAGGLVVSTKLRRMDRLAQMTMAASTTALRSANLSLDGQVALRTGVVFNTWFGPMQTTEAYITSIVEQGQKLTPASLYPLTVPNASTGLVTMELKALGPNLTISGSSAVRLAVDAIRQDLATVMLAGGSDELTPTVVDSFKSCGLIPADEKAAARGFALAEGAIVLVLEEACYAERRRAPAIAEIVECASGNSLPYTGAPFDFRADYIARTMRCVLERAEVGACDIGAFVSGDNGAPGLAAVEREALIKVFGEALPEMRYPKCEIGELAGASGSGVVLQAALTASELAPNTRSGRRNRRPYLLANCYELCGDITTVLLRPPSHSE
jgi:3-oxoacyl-[acyl-carrier-protein] synthase II